MFGHWVIIVFAVCFVADVHGSEAGVVCGYCMDEAAKILFLKQDYEGMLVPTDVPPCSIPWWDDHYTKVCVDGCVEIAVKDPQGNPIGLARGCGNQVYLDPHNPKNNNPKDYTAFYRNPDSYNGYYFRFASPSGSFSNPGDEDISKRKGQITVKLVFFGFLFAVACCAIAYNVVRFRKYVSKKSKNTTADAGSEVSLIRKDTAANEEQAVHFNVEGELLTTRKLSVDTSDSGFTTLKSSPGRIETLV